MSRADPGSKKRILAFPDLILKKAAGNPSDPASPLLISTHPYASFPLLS